MQPRRRRRDGRTRPAGGSWTHASSYVGQSPAALVHRARLAHLGGLLRRIGRAEDGLLIDLGCSDGFVLSELSKDGYLRSAWRLVGYDHSLRLLARARERGIPRAEFHVLDLNDAGSSVLEPGNVVLCLETLEHVGDYRSALRVIDAAMCPGARLVLSMPNEVGMVGLGKLLGRPLLRRDPYVGFFTGPGHRVRYAVAVATYRDLERFRTPPRTGWAPHLGFDYRAVMHHIQREYLRPGTWRVERVERSAFGANHFLVIRRTT